MAKIASPYWKWYILFLASMATFGGYFSFDFPSALHGPAYRHFLSYDPSLTPKTFEFQFSLMYSLYSLPNMVLPCIGGMLSDRWGNNNIMVIFAALVLLGNFIQTYAICNFDMTALLIGRFIFGLGAETLQVCANTTISKWFNDHGLALSMGINLSACKFGGVLTAWVSPFLAKQFGVDKASIFVSGLCTLCFALTVILYFQEPQYEPEGNRDSSALILSERTRDTSYSSLNSHSVGHYDSVELIPRHNSDIRRKGRERNDRFNKEEDEFSSIHGSALDKAVRGDHDHERLHNCFMMFAPSVWLVFILTFMMYGTFIPFSNISNAVLLEAFFPGKLVPGSQEYQENEIQAAKYVTTKYFSPIFYSKIFFVDCRVYRIF